MLKLTLSGFIYEEPFITYGVEDFEYLIYSGKLTAELIDAANGIHEIYDKKRDSHKTTTFTTKGLVYDFNNWRNRIPR